MPAETPATPVLPKTAAEPAIAAAIAELRRLFDAFRAERTKG